MPCVAHGTHPSGLSVWARLQEQTWQLAQSVPNGIGGAAGDQRLKERVTARSQPLDVLNVRQVSLPQRVENQMFHVASPPVGREECVEAPPSVVERTEALF